VKGGDVLVLNIVLPVKIVLVASIARKKEELAVFVHLLQKRRLFLKKLKAVKVQKKYKKSFLKVHQLNI
jgi:hypothetical protein